MEAVLIIALAALCTGLPFWLGERYGAVRLVSPMHVLSYFCFFGFLLKVTVFAFAPEYAFYRRFVDNPWADQQGALYLALFILLTCLGYRVAYGHIDRGQGIFAARLVSAGIARRGLLGLCAFGVTLSTIVLILRARGLTGLDLSALAEINSAKQININANGVGATLAGLKTFFIVPKFAFVLLLAHGIVSENWKSKMQAGLLGTLMLVIALVSGDRFELIELMAFALATFMIVGGKIDRRAMILGIVGMCFLGVLSIYMTVLRHGGQDHGVWQEIVGSTYFLDINVAIMVTDRMTPQAYMLGGSYTWWTFGWVPRAFWFDKPAIDLGVFFKRDLMEVLTGGAYNVTGPGEAFINFGWAGVLVGFVLGWIYRRGEEMLLAASATLSHGAAFLYPVLFYPFIQATLQSSFSAFIVVAAAQFVLIMMMISIFVTRYRVRLPSQRNQLYVV